MTSSGTSISTTKTPHTAPTHPNRRRALNELANYLTPSSVGGLSWSEVARNNLNAMYGGVVFDAVTSTDMQAFVQGYEKLEQLGYSPEEIAIIAALADEPQRLALNPKLKAPPEWLLLAKKRLSKDHNHSRKFLPAVLAECRG